MRCRVRRRPNAVFHATRLPFDPGSPAIGCALRDGRRPTWRSFGARASHAGLENGQAKANAYSPAPFQAPSAEGLSLSGGASFRF
jgi:hypothetical protein